MNNVIITKYCSACNQLKPLDDFFNDKSRSDGKSSRCKECILNKNKEIRLKNKLKRKMLKKRQIELDKVSLLSNNNFNLLDIKNFGYKKCNKCNTIKSVDNFHNLKTNKDGKDTMCKLCVNKNINQWYHKNKDHIKEVQKIWREKNYIKLWATNTIKCHRKSGYDINITKEFVYNLAINTEICPICGCKLDWEAGTKQNNKTPTLDRFNNENILNDNNVWIICRKCNVTKSNRTFVEFVEYCNNVVEKFTNHKTRTVTILEKTDNVTR